MGITSSKHSKPRPIPAPPEGQFGTRKMIANWKPKPGKPPIIDIHPWNASERAPIIAIKYNQGSPDEPGDTFELNGRLTQLSRSVSDAIWHLHRVQATGVTGGLTNNWPPGFWLYGVCVNERDEREKEWVRRQNLESYVFAAATYVLDLTQPKARIFHGATAFDGPVGNLLDALANGENFWRHQAVPIRGLIWTEP